MTLNKQVKNLCEGVALAVRTKQFLESELQRNAAVVMSIFWRDCYPVLAQMVGDMVPKAMATSSLLQANPWLASRQSELIEAAKKAKGDNPAGGLFENLERAIESMRETEPSGELAKTGD